MSPHRAKNLPNNPELPPHEQKTCRHCFDTIPRESYCEDCKIFLVNQCSACHDELSHEKVRVQNINTMGGRKTVHSAKRGIIRYKRD